MNKAEFKVITQKGNNLQAERLAPGLYAGQKVNDNYIVLAENSDGKWSPIEKPEELKAGSGFVSLTNVKNIETGRIVPISVPNGFDELPVNTAKSYFAFRINTKLRSEVLLKSMDKKQAEKLITAREVA